MRTAFLLVWFLLIVQNNYGQLTVRYRDASNTIVEMPTNSITSDFGRRYGSWSTNRWSPTLWHRGVDYAPADCNGRRLVTIASGRVVGLSSTYKILTIEGGSWSGTSFTPNTNDFAYGHIFNDAAIGANGILSGNFVFLQMNGYSSDYAILDIGTTPYTAIGRIEGATVTYSGQSYTVTRRINANQEIAPIGDSGGDYPPHLHLYRPVDPNTDVQDKANAKNPFEAVNHANTQYAVTIDGLNRLVDATATSKTWNAGTENSSVRVKVAMNGGGSGSTYSNVAYDIEEVKLFLKKSYEGEASYKLITGKVLESRICNGGKLANTRYPIDGEYDVAWEPGSNVLHDGSFTRTGVEPHAYRNGNYDFFFFSDIYTLIHKNQGSSDQFAPINKYARYPDGKYDIYAQATRVANNTPTSSGVTSIIIDNFRPYVEKIEVINYGLNYSAEWKPDASGANMELTLEGSKLTLEYCFATTIRVRFSEPMATCTLKVNNVVKTPIVGSPSADLMTWEYLIPKQTLPSLAEIPLSISGTDLAGNKVFKLPAGFVFTPPAVSTPVPVTNFPVRTSTTAFSNPGSFADDETSYRLYRNMLKSGETCTPDNVNLPVADFSVERSSSDDNTFTFTNKSSFATKYYWDFGDGTSSDAINPGTKVYASDEFSKTYKVKLRAVNSDGIEDTETRNVYVPGTNNEASITVSCSASPTTNDYEYLFATSVSGGSTTYTYDVVIDFGDGSAYSEEGTSGIVSKNHQYECSSKTTIYNPFVSMVVYDDDGDLVSEEFYELDQIVISPPVYIELDVTFNTIPERVVVNKPFKLTGTVANGAGDLLDWYWTIYDTKTPGSASKTCGTNCFYNYPVTSTNTCTTPALTIPYEGSYLGHLQVVDRYGHYFATEFTINVYSGSPCVEAGIYNTQNRFPKGCTVSFGYYAYLGWGSECLNSYDNTNLYDDVAKLEWFKDGSMVDQYMKYANSACGYYSDVICADVPRGDYACSNGNGCFKFPSEGVFNISLKAYAGNLNYTNTQWIINDDVNTTATKTITIVDCNKSLTLVDVPSIINNVVNGRVASGVVSILPTVGTKIVVPVGVGGIIEANTKIVIKPGFVSKAGSHLRFRIDPCPKAPTSCTTDCEGYKYGDALLGNLQTNNPESLISTSPNPFKSAFTVRFSQPQEVNAIIVTDLLGRRVWADMAYSDGNELTIDLSDEPDGVYLLRVSDSSGMNMCKIIKQQ